MTRVKTLLLTRPYAQSRALADEIRGAFPDRAECLISPLLEIEFLDGLPDVSDFQALIFTSVNGVKAYADRDGPKGMQCYCVGDKTAAAARSLGLIAKSANGDASSLVALVADTRDHRDGPLLHIRGEHTTGDIIAKLAALGFEAEDIVLYQQNLLPFTPETEAAFLSGEIQGLPLYSPRTARQLVHILRENPDWPRGNLTALCLSKNIAQQLEELGLGHITTARAPNHVEMVALLGRFLS
ncbi:MAG: uroporphyrinogen-III synthase [Alphaproteobacteria bacterium]